MEGLTVDERAHQVKCHDVCDLTIEAFAEENAMLLEHQHSLQSDVRSYRELAVALLDALHDALRQLERERQAHARTRQEYAALRGEVVAFYEDVVEVATEAT